MTMKYGWSATVQRAWPSLGQNGVSWLSLCKEAMALHLEIQLCPSELGHMACNLTTLGLSSPQFFAFTNVTQTQPSVFQVFSRGAVFIVKFLFVLGHK